MAEPMGLNKDMADLDGMTAVERALKRAGDIVWTIVLLTVLSPVLIYIYHQKMIASGHVIYSQERIGKGDKPFRIYKFRSMEKMLRCLDLDLYYLRYRSLWLDIKILTKTLCNI